jgi:cell division protein FtsB
MTKQHKRTIKYRYILYLAIAILMAWVLTTALHLDSTT